MTDQQNAIIRHDEAVARLRETKAARVVSLANLHQAIRHAYRLGVSQGRIGALVGLTQQRVSQIVAGGTEYLT